MLKRTIVVQNPCWLNKKDNQLVIQNTETGEENTVCIEDIGILLLESFQINLTASLLAFLAESGVAVIPCKTNKMPAGLLLPIDGHHLQQANTEAQLSAKKPLNKRLWQQIVRAKITNQAHHLEDLNVNTEPMHRWAKDVLPGDTKNHEARAAKLYWRELFNLPHVFERDPEGDPPNNLLNYGYAVLRSILARAIVLAGLHPSIGIFHRNQYNAWCLADDLMEPYRPWVDRIARTITAHRDDYFSINKPIKEELLQIPVLDVKVNGEKSPLMVAAQQTASSLAKIYRGEAAKIVLPVWV